MKFAAAVLLSLALPGAVIASEIEQVAGGCDDCHGPGGVSGNAEIPTIAGQPRSLIQKALHQFRGMGRPCRRSAYPGDTVRGETTMCNISSALSNDQIEALGRHYEAMEFRPAVQPFDETMAIAGASLHALYCDSCHPMGGSEPGFAGRLAGQWAPYLARATRQIAAGERIVPKVMERKLSEFSDKEIDSLVHFWASQQD